MAEILEKPRFLTFCSWKYCQCKSSMLTTYIFVQMWTFSSIWIQTLFQTLICINYQNCTKKKLAYLVTYVIRNLKFSKIPPFFYVYLYFRFRYSAKDQMFFRFRFRFRPKVKNTLSVIHCFTTFSILNLLKNEDAIPSAKTCHKTAELTHKPRVHRLKSCLHSYGQGHSCSLELKKKNSVTVKSRAVDRSTIQFWTILA